MFSGNVIGNGSMTLYTLEDFASFLINCFISRLKKKMVKVCILIGKGLPYNGSLCRFETGLIPTILLKISYLSNNILIRRKKKIRELAE